MYALHHRDWGSNGPLPEEDQHFPDMSRMGRSGLSSYTAVGLIAENLRTQLPIHGLGGTQFRVQLCAS
jgi:hypothetical protein